MRRAKSETRAWLILGTLIVVTFSLTFLVALVLPAQWVYWSGLGMLLWITLAGILSAFFFAGLRVDRFGPLALRSIALLGWLTLIMCALPWGLMLFKPNSNLFTVLYPVTMPWAVRTLWFGGRKAPLPSARTMLLTISVIAAAHLLYFFGSAANPTRIYLTYLALISLAAAHRHLPELTNARQG